MTVLFFNPQQEMGGIQCLSAFLRKHGHVTQLFNDPRLFDNPWIQFKRFNRLFEKVSISEGLLEIERKKPDLIAFSVVSDDYEWALNWSKHIKSVFDIPIVFGNCHPTFFPEKVLENASVDFIIRGEGELTLLELVNALESGDADFGMILGLGYRENGICKVNPMRPLIEDLDILPFPDKDLYYETMPYLNHGYTTMTGRGCPYRCTFCDNNSSILMYRNNGIKQKWTRRHSPERVVDEILWAQKSYDIKHVRFNDEDFSYNKEWIRQFCAIYKERVRIPYFAWVYPNTIDKEIAEILAESGCDSVEMGIQSGSEHLRVDIMHRKTSDAQILKAMEALRNAGIRVTVDIIIGLPSETKNDLDLTVDLVRKARPWHVYVFWLRYYPSTEILDLAKKRKLLSPEQIEFIETNQSSRGHISGGTELEKSRLSRSYHAFIVLMPLMPDCLIGFFRRYDLIRFFPSFLNPFFLVNITKSIKRDKYNEFRIRGGHMLLWEVPRLFLRLLSKRQWTSWRGSVRPIFKHEAWISKTHESS